MRLNHFKFNNQTGMALVLVLVFTSLLLVLGAAVLNYAATETLIARYQVQDIEKFYIADAGIEAGLTALANDYYIGQTITGNIMDGIYHVTFINLSGDRRKVVSTGTIDEFSLTIEVSVSLCPEEGLIIENWAAQ
ncbi:MAG: hypothetical protein SCJ97_09090 [Bacillota bacterium]|nr:hypothetical protein [Bacillota bacterium]